MTEADRARAAEEVGVEEVAWIKKELGDIKSELKPVGSEARGAAATATALNVEVKATVKKFDKIELDVEAVVQKAEQDLEPRIGQLEQALRRLAGTLDIKSEMAAQSAELAKMLAGKADSSEVTANSEEAKRRRGAAALHRSDRIRGADS